MAVFAGEGEGEGEFSERLCPFRLDWRGANFLEKLQTCIEERTNGEAWLVDVYRNVFSGLCCQRGFGACT